MSLGCDRDMTSHERRFTRDYKFKHNAQELTATLTADEGQNMRKIGALFNVRLATAKDDGADSTRNAYRMPQRQSQSPAKAVHQFKSNLVNALTMTRHMIEYKRIFRINFERRILNPQQSK